MEGLEVLFSCYLFIINLITFAAMGLDKSKAKRGKWRIPEKTLFFLALIGGALGGIIGMRVFRHKTKHWTFQLGFPVLFILNLVMIYYLTF